MKEGKKGGRSKTVHKGKNYNSNVKNNSKIN